MLVCLMLFQRSLRSCSFLFIFLSLFSSVSDISTSLSSISLVILTNVFCCWFLLVYFSFQLYCSFLFFKKFLKNSYNFLTCASIFFFLRFCIIAIISLNAFSCSFSIFTSLSCSSEVFVLFLHLQYISMPSQFF